MTLRILMCGGRRLSDAAWSIARGFERLGHSVRHIGTRKPGTKYDPLDDVESVLSKVVREWDPDLLLWVMCKHDCPKGLIGHLRRLSPRLKTIFHSFDDPEQIDSTGTPWIAGFEYAITCCEGSVAFYQQHGLEAVCLYPPADRELHGSAKATAEEQCDFSFSATNVYSRLLFPKVLAERVEIARLASKIGQLHLYGPWEGTRSTWGGSFGAPDLRACYRGRRTWNEMPTIYASSGITLNSHNRPDGYRYLNERTVHAIASGSFVLTDKVAGIEDVLTPGVYLDTWSCSEEAREKMVYWYKHSDKRTRIAAAGRSFVLEHFDNVAHNRKLLSWLRVS